MPTSSSSPLSLPAARSDAHSSISATPFWGGPDHRIIGYYANDVDTEIFIHYKPNGRFDQPIDSYVYIDEDVVGGYIFNETDTQYLAIGFNGNTPGSQRINDLKLILPGVRTYTFTDVMVNGNFTEEDEFKCSTGSFGCHRTITSMKIDGVYHDFYDRNMRFVFRGDEVSGIALLPVYHVFSINPFCVSHTVVATLTSN